MIGVMTEDMSCQDIEQKLNKIRGAISHTEPWTSIGFLEVLDSILCIPCADSRAKFLREIKEFSGDTWFGETMFDERGETLSTGFRILAACGEEVAEIVEGWPSNVVALFHKALRPVGNFVFADAVPEVLKRFSYVHALSNLVSSFSSEPPTVPFDSETASAGISLKMVKKTYDWMEKMKLRNRDDEMVFVETVLLRVIESANLHGESFQFFEPSICDIYLIALATACGVFHPMDALEISTRAECWKKFLSALTISGENGDAVANTALAAHISSILFEKKAQTYFLNLSSPREEFSPEDEVALAAASAPAKASVKGVSTLIISGVSATESEAACVKKMRILSGETPSSPFFWLPKTLEAPSDKEFRRFLEWGGFKIR